MSARKRILAELATIAKQHGGLVSPAAVVEFARDESTALHSQFQWDDGIAAEQYRIWQARHLLRVCVVTVENHDEPVIAHVSLVGDRNADGGYRRIEAVLGDPSLRDRLLDTALRELEAFRRKYASLQELCEVFAALDKVRGRRRNAV